MKMMNSLDAYSPADTLHDAAAQVAVLVDLLSDRTSTGVELSPAGTYGMFRMLLDLQATLTRMSRSWPTGGAA